MKLRQIVFVLAMTALIVAAARLSRQSVEITALAQSQQNSQAASQQTAPPAAPQAPANQDQSPLPTTPVLRTESRVVRVDVVVTDKKGNYVTDLKADDFKVFEDNKQQSVSTFSFGMDPSAPAGSQRHYMVLFFDNSTMEFGDQAQARSAASKFIDANAGPDRVMAVVDFGGATKIVQNFTADAVRLKAAVAGVKGSAVNPNAPPADDSTAAGMLGDTSTAGGMLTLGNSEADFGARSVLLAIRDLAKNLAAIPGRKTLVLLTAGFPTTPEIMSELTATIDACNKANVAIYPLDVRGLVAPIGASSELRRDKKRMTSRPFSARATPRTRATVKQPGLVLASFHMTSGPKPARQQHGGGGVGGHGGGGTGGGGGSGGGTGGGSGGGKGGSGGTGGGTGGGKGGGTGTTSGGGGRGGGAAGLPGTTGVTQPRSIVPSFPESTATNQQVLYALAEGTGGFPIFNTNDLLAGLEKIAREQNAYYLLGYAPATSPEGSCHTLKVKVERGGTAVRSRSGYCNLKPADLLAGQPIERSLEARATAAAPGNMGGTIEAPFFYTAPNTARVNLAMDIPSKSVAFSKVKGKYHADVNILGIAYRTDGSIGARFSDSVTLDLDKDEWKEFTKEPWFYQNQLAIAPGQYRFDVVVSCGDQDFGKFESPLAIDPYDGKRFTISAALMSSGLERVSDAGAELDSALLEDRTPLMVKGLEVIPSGNNSFKKTDKAIVYAQVYEPRMMDPKPPNVRIGYRIMDPKTGKQMFTSGGVDATDFVQKGNPVISIGLKVPIDDLRPGAYRIDVQAGESGGTTTPMRSVNFEIE